MRQFVLWELVCSSDRERHAESVKLFQSAIIIFRWIRMGVATIIGHLVLMLTYLAVLLRSASGINCYQCVSTSHDDPFQCNEFLGSDVDLVPKSCDAVFGAQYCIKHTGRFEAMGIDCYQCSSSESIYCSDNMIQDGILTATTCDHVFEASYCIKTVGLYGGGLGTKRFCSSLDLGNYCNYIRQPGDQLEYRSCVFTCSTDGCNLAESKRPHHLVTLLSLALVTAIATF